MIIPKHNVIINIEVKLGPKDQGDKLKLLKDASDQTKQHFSFMQQLFGEMLCKDWVFVRAACVPYLEIVEGAEIPCVNCQQFILQDVDDVTPWLDHIFEHKLVTSDNHNQTVYEDLVAELIYHISIKESSRFNHLISDPLTISKEVEKALTGKSDGISSESNVSVYMLNNEQLQAVNLTSKFLIIDGDYGTGKTYVLKERAKKCATVNHQDLIFYVDLTAITNYIKEESYTYPTSVMEEMAKVEFESYPNVRVITIGDLIGISRMQLTKTEEIMYSIYQFCRDNLCDHLFIDEMKIGSCEFPGSVKTICMTMKVNDGYMKKRSEWIETMIKNHNALCFNLTKNLRNSQLIHKFSEAFNSQTPPKLPDNNVIGNHIYYYHNIHNITPGLLAIAAIKKYFSLQPQEGVVVLTNSITYYNSIFELIKKHFSSTRPVVSDFKTYMNKPEGILVTNFYEFQGAQARNIIIIDDYGEEGYNNYWIRNMILRAMSFVILISRQKVPEGNKFGAIVDENLHGFIYADRKAIDCHHYHNKDKHDISAITMSIVDKYNLLEKDEGIMIVTYNRISKNIVKEANTKKFLSLTREERKKQVGEKIKLENKELYEELKKNISRKYDEISWSYYDDYEIKDLVNKPRHINYINFKHLSEFSFIEARNIIVFADENIDHKHEFAALGWYSTLDYSDNETSINFNWSQRYRNRCEACSRDIIWESQPKFAIVVHDGKIDTISQPKEALNLIEDDNLQTQEVENSSKLIKNRKKCSIL